MTLPVPVSLVVVSRERPAQLSNLLQSLRHQTHKNFEVVLVADHLPEAFAGHVKFIPFGIANISAARNTGIAAASGEVIAFCDDDAIPDPPWLDRLIAPLHSTTVGAATGFTRGRNGISRQWGAMRFDHSGADHTFEIDESEPFEIFDASTDFPVKLLGTNMAFRKDALLDINGFDEAFRFFLDETDAKLRLDAAGWKTAIVSNAQVQHGFAASARRKRNRVPSDLFEIGASKAYFCTKHSNDSVDDALRSFTKEQLSRLTAMVDDYRLQRREVDPLMETLAAGFTEGLNRQTETPLLLSEPSTFLKFETNQSEHIVICATPHEAKQASSAARALTEVGKCVSVIQLLNSPRYFQVRYKNGYWLHIGGVLGKSVRTQPLVQFTSYKRRFEAEIARLSKLYPVDKVIIGPRATEYR